MRKAINFITRLINTLISLALLLFLGLFTGVFGLVIWSGGQVITLSCERIEPTLINCLIESKWLGVVPTTTRSLKGLQQVEVVGNNNYFLNISLQTKTEKIHLIQDGNNNDAHLGLFAKRLQAFIDNPDVQSWREVYSGLGLIIIGILPFSIGLFLLNRSIASVTKNLRATLQTTAIFRKLSPPSSLGMTFANQKLPLILLGLLSLLLVVTAFYVGFDNSLGGFAFILFLVCSGVVLQKILSIMTMPATAAGQYLPIRSVPEGIALQKKFWSRLLILVVTSILLVAFFRELYWRWPFQGGIFFWLLVVNFVIFGAIEGVLLVSIIRQFKLLRT